MKFSDVKKSLASGEFNTTFDTLYTDVEENVQRYEAACDRFAHYFGAEREVSLFSAPGRTEVGGNHTDHQFGCVLAGSVNLDVIAVVSKNDSGIVRIKSKGFDIDEVDITSTLSKAKKKNRLRLFVAFAPVLSSSDSKSAALMHIQPQM